MWFTISLAQLGVIYDSVLFLHLFQVLNQTPRVQEGLPQPCKPTTPVSPTFLVLFSIAHVTMGALHTSNILVCPCSDTRHWNVNSTRRVFLFCFVFYFIHVPRVVPDTNMFQTNKWIDTSEKVIRGYQHMNEEQMIHGLQQWLYAPDLYS